MSAKVRLLVHRMNQQLRPLLRATHQGPHVSQTTSAQHSSTKSTPQAEGNTSSYLSNAFLQSENFHSMAKSKQLGRPYTVVVEGNIGSGKTTFLQPFMESTKNSLNPISELVEVTEEPVSKWRNCQGTNLLQLMYEDPKRWSLMFQTYVHLTMIQNHTSPCTKPIRLMERSLARYCFLENLYNGGNMTDAEYAVLSEWFNFLITCPQLDLKIDQIVYLRTDPEVAYERIKKRSRPEEHLIPFTYLKDLHELHEDWLVRKTKFQPLAAPVTIIDANADLEILSERYRIYGEELLQQATVEKTAVSNK